jgi:ABC-type multidrug transport system ATPase subunit
VEGFALGPHLHKPMFMLSTGSRRKVWLAAALASSRPLTLLDEPTGGLDAPAREYLSRALSALAAQRERAVVVASGEGLAAVALTGTITLPFQGA